MASVRRGTISNTASSDGEVCAVCGGGVDAGAFVDCDACDVRVHAGCYGVLGAPPQRWFCDPCQSGRRGSRAAHADPKCGLCGTHGSGLKRVGRKGWAHVCCVLWTPELEVDDAMCADDLDVGPERASVQCDVCGRGNAIRCGHASCRRAAHASCALSPSTPFALSTAGEDPDQPFEVLCERHRQLTQSPRAPPRDVVDLTADSPRPRRSAASSSIASPSPPPRRLRRLRKNHHPEISKRGSSASAPLSFLDDEESVEASDAALARRLQAEEHVRAAAASDSDSDDRARGRRRRAVADSDDERAPRRRRRRAVAGSEGDDVLDDEAECSDASADESDNGSADDRKAARDSLLNDESEDDGGFDHSRFDLSRRSSVSIGAALGRGGSKRVRRGGVLQAALQHASGGGEAMDFEDAYNNNRYRDQRSFSSGGGDASRYLDTDEEDDEGEEERNWASPRRGGDGGWTASRRGDDEGTPWADRRLPTMGRGDGWSCSPDSQTGRESLVDDDAGDDWGGRFQPPPARRRPPRKKKKSSFEASQPPPGRALRRGPRKSSFRVPVPVARKRPVEMGPASQLSQEAPPRRSRLQLVPAAVALSQEPVGPRRAPTPPPPRAPRRTPPTRAPRPLRPANAPKPAGLTGEQKARIARNKAAALARQRARLQNL